MSKAVFQKIQELRQGGDRRKSDDRRKCSFALHIPERRSNEERRSGIDRRRQ